MIEKISYVSIGIILTLGLSCILNFKNIYSELSGAVLLWEDSSEGYSEIEGVIITPILAIEIVENFYNVGSNVCQIYYYDNKYYCSYDFFKNFYEAKDKSVIMDSTSGKILKNNKWVPVGYVNIKYVDMFRLIEKCKRKNDFFNILGVSGQIISTRRDDEDSGENMIRNYIYKSSDLIDLYIGVNKNDNIVSLGQIKELDQKGVLLQNETPPQSTRQKGKRGRTEINN